MNEYDFGFSISIRTSYKKIKSWGCNVMVTTVNNTSVPYGVLESC